MASSNLLRLFIFLLKFVADGIFKAELNEFLTRELAEDGYSGVEVRVTPTRTEIIILATRSGVGVGLPACIQHFIYSVYILLFSFKEKKPVWPCL